MSRLRRVPLPATSRWRLLVMQVVIVGLLASLGIRLYQLQVGQGQAYQNLAQSNRTRPVLTPAVRGTIVDDAGRLLAANRVSMVVTADRSVIDKLKKPQRTAIYSRLAAILGVPRTTVEARTRFCGEPGAQKPPVCWNGSPYQPIPVAKDVEAQVAVQVMEQRAAMPGVTAATTMLRYYPFPSGANAAQVIGYLSPIVDSELAAIAARGGDEVSHRQDLVGRAGLERTYDKQLRGIAGVKQVEVNHLGQAAKVVSQTSPVPGSTLVTSLDARLQAYTETQLATALTQARQTFDKVTRRKYVADSGAAIVLDNRTGRVLAMASNPTYNPNVWSGGITKTELAKLYSPATGIPLLSRAFQAQLAPGSTFKPISTAAALNNGYRTDSTVMCSSDYQVGGRRFKNYESKSFGSITFQKALAVSCDTVFYRVAYAMWLKAGGMKAKADAHDPIVLTAKQFGLGRKTGLDLPGEVAGRIADRNWKLKYYDAMKGYYCRVAGQNKKSNDFLHKFAREFCVDGYRYRAGDAVNFAIGQGDTMVSPIQLAIMYAALANGGTLWKPTIGAGFVTPDGRRTPIRPQAVGKLPLSPALLRYVNEALHQTVQSGTASWKFQGFPLNVVKLHAKTGTAEVYGKQTTGWLATYDRNYTVVMMISQGGTGSGSSGVAVRKIWEAIYGIDNMTVNPARSLLPANVRKAPR